MQTAGDQSRTIIILFPGDRHRYRPDHETGWDEYWIGLKGDIIDNLVRKNFIRQHNPSIYIGFHEGIFNLFNNIIEVTKRESMGYQPLISGAALHLMGFFHFTAKQHTVKCEEKEMIIWLNRPLCCSTTFVKINKTG